MTKEVLAIDIDEVISSEVDAIIAFTHERLGKVLTHEDFQTPGEYWGYYELLWTEADVQPSLLFEEFLASEHKSGQTILQQDLEVFLRLKKRFDLQLVTSRTSDFKEITIQMLETHSPGIFSDVHFVDLWHQPSLKATKAYICQEIGAGYLIDDSVEHCNIAAAAGITALLFGHWGWNTNKEIHERVVRVSDWTDVAEYFHV